MTSEKDKAEAYVRGQIPELRELSFGCEVAWTYSHALNSVAHTPITKRGVVILPNHMLGFGRGEWVLLNGNKAPREIKAKDLHIIGHPIQLQHWLRVLAVHHPHKEIGSFNRDIYTTSGGVNFNLTTGQPATEEDYKAFNSIIGV